MNAFRKVDAYQKQSQKISLIDADPHEVISVMMSAVLDNIAVAKGATTRNQLELRTNAINKAIRIISGLQDGLNMEISSDISENFYNLYDYMVRRLSDTNITNDLSGLDEVGNLLGQIYTAWRDMPVVEKNKGLELLAQRS